MHLCSKKKEEKKRENTRWKQPHNVIVKLLCFQGGDMCSQWGRGQPAWVLHQLSTIQINLLRAPRCFRPPRRIWPGGSSRTARGRFGTGPQPCFRLKWVVFGDSSFLSMRLFSCVTWPGQSRAETVWTGLKQSVKQCRCPGMTQQREVRGGGKVVPHLEIMTKIGRSYPMKEVLQDQGLPQQLRGYIRHKLRAGGSRAASPSSCFLSISSSWQPDETGRHRHDCHRFKKNSTRVISAARRLLAHQSNTLLPETSHIRYLLPQSSRGRFKSSDHVVRADTQTVIFPNDRHNNSVWGGNTERRGVQIFACSWNLHFYSCQRKNTQQNAGTTGCCLHLCAVWRVKSRGQIFLNDWCWCSRSDTASISLSLWITCWMLWCSPSSPSQSPGGRSHYLFCLAP